MNTSHVSVLAGLIGLLIGGAAGAGGNGQALAGKSGFDMAQVERGRYLVTISGCNDCHTRGYLQGGGAVPLEEWLTGDNFGWRGPWGTTYGANLRLKLGTMSEDEWVSFAHSMKARPTMPWFTLNAMTVADLQAIYQFVRYLGPAGAPAPDYLPPDQEPTGPYALFPGQP